MQAFVGGANAILLLLTVVFLGSVTLIGLLAWRRRNQALLRKCTAVGAATLVVYSALLLSAALTSKQRVLASGEVKWFCGFYLDCHLGVSVAKVESAKSIPGANGNVVAEGIFKIVTVQFHNSARNQSLDMTLYHPRATIIDADGRTYARSAAAEDAIARTEAFAKPVKEMVAIKHAPSLGTMVFDVPADAIPSKLSIDEGFIVDRVLELVLVNDDNSVFHKPTFLALSESGTLPPTSYLRNTSGPTLRVRLASR